LTSKRDKAFIGVTFRCCRVYARIYLNKAGDAFIGWCPKCAAKMEVGISDSGSSLRFFQAG
jgi:hypothetical protein